MKKTFILLVIAVLSISVFAQEEGSLKSKNDKEILPQTGDFGFGVDGIQFINYAGNFFNQSGNNSMSLRLPDNGQTFFIKYVANPKTFYRLKLRIGYQTVKDLEYITKQATTIDPTKTVEDSYKNTKTNLGLSFGIEKRKGSIRLQGFYGGEVGVFYVAEKDVYEYSNDLESNSSVPLYSTNFGNNLDFTTNNQGYAMRTIDKSYGNTIGFGAGLFFGAEYFFAPKISVAGEFGWNISYAKTGENNTNYKFWNPVSQKENDYKSKGAGNSVFGVDNTPTGLLTLSLYF